MAVYTGTTLGNIKTCLIREGDRFFYDKSRESKHHFKKMHVAVYMETAFNYGIEAAGVISNLKGREWMETPLRGFSHKPSIIEGGLDEVMLNLSPFRTICEVPESWRYPVGAIWTPRDSSLDKTYLQIINEIGVMEAFERKEPHLIFEESPVLVGKN